MSETESAYPAGDVDLTNCDREPIHTPGRIQDYGCLIALSSDWMISHASENCGAILGSSAESIVGCAIVDFLPESTVHDMRSHMQMLNHQQNGVVRMFAYAVFGDSRLFDLSIHRSGRQIICEFEQRRSRKDDLSARASVQSLIGRVQRHDNVPKMAKEAARGLKALAGFDRVMVYRFEEDFTGTVIAEALEPGMEPYLGLRYPASDIPKQARELYTRNLLRVIADVDGDTYPIHPEFDPNGEPLDLSLAVTRAVSPIHLEYLRNMGVQASMSVSILRRGKLWGLFACHHSEPRYLSYEERTEVELFAQLFNYELTQAEMDTEFADIDRARRLHDRLMPQLSSGQSIFDLFEGFADDIREVIPFDGAAIYADGNFRAIGSTPTEEEFLGLVRFLNAAPPAEIYSTDNLGARYPKAADFTDRAAGLLALPISRTPRDYLVLFRRELAKSVNWAGNPEKPVELGPNGLRLTPRKSFEAWQEVVRGHSAPWTSGERRAAEALRVTLLEVVLKLADETIATRRKAQDQQELLIAELNHRVRNILNLIRGLVSQGKKDAGSIDDYQAVLDARIYALARAHDQLTHKEWSWVPLRSLVQTEIKAYLSEKSTRVSLTGDEIDLSPAAFTTLALVIHELVTNSAKYGCLSDSSGTVLLNVVRKPDDTATLTWVERNGPAVQAPTRRGFGTTIIEHSIPFELKGTAEVHYKVTGLEAEFMIPSSHVRGANSAVEAKEDEASPVGSNVGITGSALVLEDNMIIALDAADMLQELGASAVKKTSRVTDALRAIEKTNFSFALLDVNLGEELSIPVLEKCVELGIEVVLATGYGQTDSISKEFADVPTLKKPYTIEHLIAALATSPFRNKD